MSWLPQGISHNNDSLLTLLLGFNLIFIILLVVIARRLYYLQTKWKKLFAEAEGQRIETLLYEHLRDQMKIESDISEIKSRLASVEGISADSKRHLGVVKYDAFPDIGGNQSFAFALLDDDGSGYILSSLAGRNDCRVYCKQVVASKSEIGLSDEEKQALEIASERRKKFRGQSG